MNFVLEGFEKGVDAQVTGELNLLGPGRGAARGAARRDSFEDGCLSSAEVTAETI